MDLHEKLSYIGMSTKEIEIYLLLLEFGESTVSFIAWKLGENRITINGRAQQMVVKWFLISKNKKGVAHFTAQDPHFLSHVMKTHNAEFDAIIPTLMQMANIKSSKVKVDFYEWFNSVQRFLQDQLTSKTTIKSFYGEMNMNSELRDRIHREYIPKRVKKWILAYAILSEWWFNLDYHNQNDDTYLKYSKVVKHKFFSNLACVNIYDNKVAIWLYSSREMSWILIYSKQLYQFIDHLFSYIRDIN